MNFRAVSASYSGNDDFANRTSGWRKKGATMKNLRSRILGLLLAGTAAPAVMLPLGLAHASPQPASSTGTSQIAVTTLGKDVRTTLTAVRGSGSGGGTPVATVTVAAYERSAGKWKLIGRQLVGQRNAWFWNVVTGKGAICRFSTSGQSPYPIEVRLLVSDSIGCSAATYNFHIDKYGTLLPG
jgi:hypothetical protein